MKKFWLFTVFLILLGSTGVSYGCKKCWHSLFCGCLCNSSCMSSEEIPINRKTEPPASVEVVTREEDLVSDIHHTSSLVDESLGEKGSLDFVDSPTKDEVTAVGGQNFRRLVFSESESDAIIVVGDQRSFWLGTALAPLTLRPLTMPKMEQLRSFFRLMSDRFDRDTLDFLFVPRDLEHYGSAQLDVSGGSSIALALSSLEGVHGLIGDLINRKPIALNDYVPRHQTFQDAIVRAAAAYGDEIKDGGNAKAKAMNVMSAFLILCNRIRAYSSNNSDAQLQSRIRYKIEDKRVICIYLSVFFRLDGETVYEGGFLVITDPRNVTCYLVRPVGGSYHIEPMSL